MEIIKRKMVAEKETFVTGFNDAYNMQVSYNSNGCIALRFHKSENKEDDTLMAMPDGSRTTVWDLISDQMENKTLMLEFRGGDL